MRSATRDPRNRWTPRSFSAATRTRRSSRTEPAISRRSSTSIVSPFQLTYDVGAEGSAPDQAHLHIANPGNNGGIVVFLCSNLGNTPVGATVRECPPSPGQVVGDIVAGDVLPVVDGEPPAATPIIGAGDLEGLKLLIEQGAVYANVHTPAHAPARSALSFCPHRWLTCAPQVTGPRSRAATGVCGRGVGHAGIAAAYRGTPLQFRR